MAFLDETGLAELWSLIGSEDEKLASDIAAKSVVVTGTYTGTGSGTTKKITFNGKPQIVIIMTSSGANNDTGLTPASAGWGTQGIIMCRGQARIMYSGNYGFPISFGDNSVTIDYGQTSYANYGMNTSGQKYAYIAVCSS